jgi:hypothetical protein
MKKLFGENYQILLPGKSKIYMAKSPTKRIHLQVYKNISFQAGFATQRLLNKDPTVG